MNEELKQQLDLIRDNVVDNNLDHIHVNEGTEGYGKSAFSLAMANYLDPDFDVDSQVAFSGKEFRKKAKRLDNFKAIVLDEAEGLFASDHMTKENKKTVKFLRKCREKNLYIFINWPVFQEIDRKIRKHRVKTLGRAVTQGRAFVYNKSKVQKIVENDLSKSHYPDPFMKASWGDPEKAIPDVWSHYQDLKIQQIDKLEEEEEDEEEDVDWRTPAEFGELAGGASAETVRNWIKDGRIEAYKRGSSFVIPASEKEEILEKVDT
ncbi:MAG: helix-turn-helix domain-containing protein [Candidatus Nanosalina sp.]